MAKAISVWLAVASLISVAACGGGGGGGVGGGGEGGQQAAAPVALKQSLGRRIFFDTNLSTPPGQACASCHEPAVGFADPDRDVPVSRGVHINRFGNRNTPTIAYAALAPEFNPDGAAFVDLGLGSNPRVLLPQEHGKFKVPTLRNVAITPPYMHNGVFQTLEEVVDFYNTRDVLPQCDPMGNPGVDCWPAPEVAENVETQRMGNLGLTPGQVADIVAFLQTLTDGFVPP